MGLRIWGPVSVSVLLWGGNMLTGVVFRKRLGRGDGQHHAGGRLCEGAVQVQVDPAAVGVSVGEVWRGSREDLSEVAVISSHLRIRWGRKADILPRLCLAATSVRCNHLPAGDKRNTKHVVICSSGPFMVMKIQNMQPPTYEELGLLMMKSTKSKAMNSKLDPSSRPLHELTFACNQDEAVGK